MAPNADQSTRQLFDEDPCPLPSPTTRMAPNADHATGQLFDEDPCPPPSPTMRMTPNTDHATGQLFDEDPCPLPSPTTPEKKLSKPYKLKIYWRNVFIFTYFHLSSIFGVYLLFTNAKWQTYLWIASLYLVTKIGSTAGVHRLWSHRSYKATFPLRALLMLFFTMAFEGSVWMWARDHRVHHKYQETDADPYSAGRGLWFSHMGWLLQSKHPAVREKGKGIDMSDLQADGLVMFQKKYIWPLVISLCLVLPTVVPVCCWGESARTAWHVAVCLRFVLSWHAIWVVNSIAHKYGSRPYDVNFFARENKTVSFVTLGEGWHNYHHTFPWDYKTSEMGTYGPTFNLTTGFIDFFAKIGWAYDLKTVSPEHVRKRALRTGDGTHTANQERELWGWDDKDMPADDRRAAQVINRIDK